MKHVKYVCIFNIIINLKNFQQKQMWNYAWTLFVLEKRNERENNKKNV